MDKLVQDNKLQKDAILDTAILDVAILDLSKNNIWYLNWIHCIYWDEDAKMDVRSDKEG